MIIIPNVNKENSCFDCPVWSLCWDNKPTEDICKDRCPIVEPKHGQWIEDEYGIPHCSNCGTINNTVYKNYCPNCGSDNREVENGKNR